MITTDEFIYPLSKEDKKRVIYQVSIKDKKISCFLNVTEDLTILCDKECVSCLAYINFENLFDQWILSKS